MNYPLPCRSVQETTSVERWHYLKTRIVLEPKALYALGYVQCMHLAHTTHAYAAPWNFWYFAHNKNLDRRLPHRSLNYRPIRPPKRRVRLPSSCANPEEIAASRGGGFFNTCVQSFLAWREGNGANEEENYSHGGGGTH